MASYHFSVQIIGRKAGRSAVAAAAYRAGARLMDERRGEVQDFARRRGVAHTEVLLPEGVAPWLADRERLWNHVEAVEKRKDAQLAREINMALPHELSAEARLELVRSFVREQFTSQGMVADIALHDPVPESGHDPRNFHAHVMLTLRQAEVGGLRRVKTREWNSDALLTTWHAAWEVHQNRALERAGHRARVDHRSLEAQRASAEERGDMAAAVALERSPEIHIGPKARAARQTDQAPRSRPQTRPTARPKGGAWRSARNHERRQRTVNYEGIDRGSRTAWNAAIVDANRRRTYAQADKFERQAARLRQKEMRAQRALATAGSRLSRGGTGSSPVSDDVRRTMAQRHVKKARGLLAAIERILAELFRVRGLWVQRHRDLLRVQVRLPGLGRSRFRD